MRISARLDGQGCPFRMGVYACESEGKQSSGGVRARPLHPRIGGAMSGGTRGRDNAFLPRSKAQARMRPRSCSRLFRQATSAVRSFGAERSWPTCRGRHNVVYFPRFRAERKKGIK